MHSTAPHIGFDRFIRLEWATTALRIRAGLATLDILDELLNSASLGSAAKKKTLTVLNRLWIDPRPELAHFADRGSSLSRQYPNIPPSVFNWGMAIAAYPFFGKVAELIGRLSALQGNCTSAELHRRMSEIYGEREGTYRMTNMVVQTQANWGAVDRLNNRKRIIRKAPINLQNEAVISWIIEATVRQSGRAIALTNLHSMPILYLFAFDNSVPFVVANSENLELRSEGAQSQVVALRA